MPNTQETDSPITRINPNKYVKSHPLPSKLSNKQSKPLHSIANTTQVQSKNPPRYAKLIINILSLCNKTGLIIYRLNEHMVCYSAINFSIPNIAAQ
jgi:hypothetical protein